jgi:hypothetical protein
MSVISQRELLSATRLALNAGLPRIAAELPSLPPEGVRHPLASFRCDALVGRPPCRIYEFTPLVAPRAPNATESFLGLTHIFTFMWRAGRIAFWAPIVTRAIPLVRPLATARAVITVEI